MSSTFGLGFGPSAPPSIRSKARSNFSGLKLFWVSLLEPDLGPGHYERYSKPIPTLKNIWALLEPSISYFLSSLVEPDKKLMGFAKIWARVVSVIRLIYYKLFFQAQAFLPGLVPVPALNRSKISVLRWKKATDSMSPYRRHYFS